MKQVPNMAMKALALTGDEIELIYDGLDALNDRYENYKSDLEEDLEHELTHSEVNEVHASIQKVKEDIARLELLFRDFQPIVKEIRDERERATSAARDADTYGPVRDAKRNKGGRPSRKRAVSPRIRGRGLPGPDR